MNDYKFRGKTASNWPGEWVYGFLVKDCRQSYIYNGDNGDFSDCGGVPIEDLHGVRPETVGQWTGQKDKNGNDGFCGDLVKHKDGTIYQIVFNTELASFCLKFSFGRSCCFNSFDRLNKLSAYDIIGNIHDNPELLEDK